MKKIFNITTNFILGLFVWIGMLGIPLIILNIVVIIFKHLPNFIVLNIGYAVMILFLFLLILGFISTTHDYGKSLKKEIIEKYKNRKDNK